nr:hypothetical protein [Akkermansiaceae bacterium]
MKAIRLLALALVTAAPATLPAAIQIAGQSATVAFSATPWAGQISASDLINAGQATLAGAAVTATHGGFPGSGINDGATQDFTAPGGNTFFQYDTHFPAAATYQLNLASAPNGYTIHSIRSFMGWATVSQFQANQTYTVEVSVVGSSGYRPLAHVSYKPFSGSGGNYETMVTVSEDTSGVLAEHVDAVRFLFADPGNAGTAPQGTLVREIDVEGSPTATAPPPVAVQATAEFSEVDEAYATQVSAADLVNTGQPTLASFSSSVAPQFGAGGQNDGVSGLANTAAAAWYKTSQLPSVLTF